MIIKEFLETNYPRGRAIGVLRWFQEILLFCVHEAEHFLYYLPEFVFNIHIDCLLIGAAGGIVKAERIFCF